METRENVFYYSSTSSYPLDSESVFHSDMGDNETNNNNVDLFGANLTPRHSYEVTIALITAYTVVFISGALGNMLVICVISKTKRMCTVTNLFLLNLAIADLLVIFFCLPCTLLANIFLPWILGKWMCKAVAYVQGVSVCASVYSLVAVSFDRFLVIRFPLKPQLHITKLRAKSLIALIWIFSTFLTLPWLFVFNTSTIISTEYCLEIWQNETLGKAYFIVVNLILDYLLPLGLISYFYTLIWLKVLNRNNSFSAVASTTPSSNINDPSTKTTTIVVANLCSSSSVKLKSSRPECRIARRRTKTRRSSMQLQSNSAPSGQQLRKLHRKTKIQVLKMLSVVISVFAISWLPLYVIFTWFKLVGEEEELSPFQEQLLSIATPIAQWLGSSNSCINPIVYNFLDNRFRKGFRDIVQKMFGRKRKQDGISSSTNVFNTRSFRSTFHS